MTNWLLILWFAAPRLNSGVAIHTHEFRTQEFCKFAGEAFIQNAKSGWNLPQYACVPHNSN